MQVFVRDNDVDYALRQLKRKLRREGLFRELKRRRAYEKPSERRTRRGSSRYARRCSSGPSARATSAPPDAIARSGTATELPFGPPPDLPPSRWSRGESHQSHQASRKAPWLSAEGLPIGSS